MTPDPIRTKQRYEHLQQQDNHEYEGDDDEFDSEVPSSLDMKSLQIRALSQ
jgi:hypothetical protein